VTLFEAREKAKESMYEDQVAAIEGIVRAILKDPDDPGLPIVEPPEAGQEPLTGVHAQGYAGGRTEPGPFAETIPPPPAVLRPETTDYERGWRAGRGAAIRALEDLKSAKVFKTVEEATLSDALDCIANLEVKVES
jgi:hypothetical protein